MSMLVVLAVVPVLMATPLLLDRLERRVLPPPADTEPAGETP
jgi:hypothetical protein